MTDIQIDPRKLAAVVYDDRVSIDALLAAFAYDLGSAGARIAGFIQLAKDDPGCGPESPMCLRDVATGKVLPLCQVVASDAEGCRLDPERFVRAADRLHSACDTDAELIFVSRFGKLEANGRGFREAMAVAVERGRPILTAVKRGLVPNWFEFTGGVGTVLDPHLWVLEHWWREIATPRA